MSETKHQRLTFRIKKITGGHNQETSDMKRQLRHIYTDHTGRMPDMGRLERRHRSWLRFFLWGVVFVALVFVGVLAVSFYLFGGRVTTLFTSERVFTEFKLPENISSGQETRLEIRYGNDEDVALANARLTLRLPESFSLISARPESTDGNVWELGTLLPGKRSSIELEGIFLDSVGTSQRISADLIYWPENFNSEFHKTASASIILQESALKASVVSKEMVNVEEEFSYLFRLENPTDKILEDITIELVYPAGFMITKTNPKSDEADKLWRVASLVPGASLEIDVIGLYRPSATSGTGELRAVVRVFSKTLNTYVTQKEVGYTQKLAKDDFSINLLSNGSTEDSSIEFGDTVEYDILYANTGDTDISNFIIRLQLDSDIIDWLNFSDNENLTLEGTTLSWKSENFSSGGEGMVKIKIPIIANPEESDGNDFSVHAKAEASRDGGLTWKKESKTITNHITSSITLAGQARYTDTLGNIVGNGIFPPEVGKETTYQVWYTLDNGLQEINSVELLIPLEKLSVYKGGVNVSTGTINYDSNSHQVIWRIRRIPSGVVGLRASFLVSIIPSQEDLSREIALTQEATLTVQDTVSGVDVNQKGIAVKAPVK